MHVIKVDEQKRLVWSEVPDPVPKSDEILLEIHAAALNRADLLQRAGKYPPPPGWPDWMGLEAAGIVLSAPAGSRWKRGDWVCALLGGGGYAEKIAVPEKNRNIPVIAAAQDVIARRGCPAWVEVDGASFKGVIKALPQRDDIQTPIEESLIVELYSK